MGEREIVREVNALTIMPLPVRIPASWYDILPKVMPLISTYSDQTGYSMGEEVVQMFLKRWGKILIRRDGTFVWMRIGGVACYEIIPNFVKGVRHAIDSCDAEMVEKGGMQAVIQHWRVSLEELRFLDDDAVLKGRNEILRVLRPEMWHEELGRHWNYAAERAHVNFGKIRPVIRKWIAKHENQCNLDEPFGGRLSAKRYHPVGSQAVPM